MWWTAKVHSTWECHMLNDDTAKEMARAVVHWLDFQILCRRDMLLSESYLAQPIGEFLRSRHSGDVETEWNHPNLNNGTPGRPRQIDYAMFSRNKRRPVSVVEVKWADDGTPEKQRLLNDLLRLECVRNAARQGMSRYFALTGKTADVQNWLDAKVGAGGAAPTFTSDVLPMATTKTLVPVEGAASHLQKFFKRFADEYGTTLPTSYKAWLIEDHAGSFTRTVVWKVESVRSRRTFDPAVKWPHLVPAAPAAPAPAAPAPAAPALAAPAPANPAAGTTP